MLVLLAGPSGVGKTTIIDLLVKHYNFYNINTVTTRGLRPNENNKISISLDSFTELDSKGGFLCVNELYGFKYGTPLQQIVSAIDHEDVYWVLDFPLDKVEVFFSNYNVLCIIILPGSEEQLLNQLNLGGRMERQEIAVSEFIKIKSSRNKYVEIVNEKDKCFQAAKEVAELAFNHFKEIT